MSTKVLELDGNTYLSFPSLINRKDWFPNEGDFSFEVWVKPTDHRDSYILSNKKMGGVGLPGNGGVILLIKPDGTVFLVEDNSRAYYLIHTGHSAAFDGNWHHIAAVRKQWQLSIYINGVLQHVTSNGNGGANSMNVSSMSPFIIGGSQNIPKFENGLFKGYISELRLWKHARSEQQIREHMHKRIRPDSPDLLAYFPFESNYKDISPNNHQISSVGTPRFVDQMVPIHSGKQDHPVQIGEDLLITLATNLLKNVITSAGSKIGSTAMGWILTKLLGSDTEDIKNGLKEIQDEIKSVELHLEKIDAEIKEASIKLEQEIKWQAQVSQLEPYFQRVKTLFDNFTGLIVTKPTEKTIKTLVESIIHPANGIGAALDEIHSNLLPGRGGLDPNSEGILWLWMNAQRNNLLKDASNSRGDFSPSGKFFNSYTQIENYFITMFVRQVKGLVLLIESYKASGEDGLSVEAVNKFKKNMHVQFACFLDTITEFVIAYANDITLVGMLTGPSAIDNPLTRANKLLNKLGQALDGLLYLSVYYWFGGSDDDKANYPFDCGGMLSQDHAPKGVQLYPNHSAVALMPENYDPVNDQNASYYLAFPTRDHGHWGAFRYTFRLPSEPAIYTLSPALPHSVWSYAIDSSNQDEPFVSAALPIIVTEQQETWLPLNLVHIDQ